MLEDFTIQACSVVAAAQDQARQHRQPRVENAHLLLALIKDLDGDAAFVLKKLNVTAEKVKVDNSFAVAQELDHIPMSCEVQETLQRAVVEAERYERPTVGTIHLLLGLFAISESSELVSGGATQAGIYTTATLYAKGQLCVIPDSAGIPPSADTSVVPPAEVGAGIPSSPPGDSGPTTDELRAAVREAEIAALQAQRALIDAHLALVTASARGLDVMAPGAGAAAAVGIQLINRAVGAPGRWFPQADPTTP